MRCRQSARLTPAAAIRISTSPAFGSGTGRVAGTNISGPPGALISITVWVAGMLASIRGALLVDKRSSCRLQCRRKTRLERLKSDRAVVEPEPHLADPPEDRGGHDCVL